VEELLAAADLDAQHLAEQDANTVLFEGGLQHRRRSAVSPRQDLGHDYQRDLGPETCEGLA
jgi:hypothetical protein